MSLLLLLRNSVGGVVPGVYGDPQDTRTVTGTPGRISISPALDASTRIGGVPLGSSARGIGKST